MNNKTRNAQENRRAVVLAVGRALQGNESLSREELVLACPSVHIDGNVLEMLKNANLISTTRGRHAKISLNFTFAEICANIDYHVSQMTRSKGYEACKERKVLTEKKDLKEAFKRAKAGEALLQEKIASLEKLVAKLEKENTMLKEKLGANKLIIK